MGQCTASRSNGMKCKAMAIRGGFVCRVHGGSAPQVRLKAQSRIAEAKALKYLGVDVTYEEIKDPKTTLKDVAARCVALMDRLQQQMEGAPDAGQFHAFERAMDRTMEMMKAIEAMDRGREDKNNGPQVIVIDSRLPSERGGDEILDESHDIPYST